MISRQSAGSSLDLDDPIADCLAPMWTIASRAVGIVLVGAILCGCSGLMASHMGFRPDEPAPPPEDTRNCEEYKKYVEYAQQLQEAYHSRATQNRWWIYAAGIIGLGTVAATGGLAAATAVGVGTLALLSVSGGFTTGVFATLDNSALADIYTIAANRVDTAMKKADSKLSRTDRHRDQARCGEALVRLRGLVSEARTKLERARTDSAVASVERAAAQQQALRQLVATLPPDPTVVVRRAEITAIDRTTNITPGDTRVNLTVSNIRLGTVPQDEVKVLLGDQEIDVLGYSSTLPDVWVVSFNAPGSPPQASQVEYAPVLLVGTSEQRVESGAGVILRYEPPRTP